MSVTRRLWVLAMALSLALASPALAQQQFNWQQAKGTQLRVLLNKHPWQGAIEPHLKEFETLTGVKLVAEVYPEDQFRAKVLVELASAASSIDVFMSMPAQEGLKYMRAGWLQPVDEFLKNPAMTSADYNCCPSSPTSPLSSTAPRRRRCSGGSPSPCSGRPSSWRSSSAP